MVGPEITIINKLKKKSMKTSRNYVKANRHKENRELVDDSWPGFTKGKLPKKFWTFMMGLQHLCIMEEQFISSVWTWANLLILPHMTTLSSNWRDIDLADRPLGE